MELKSRKYFLESERLVMFPLTKEEHLIFANGGQAIASTFDLKYTGEEVDDFFKKILNGVADIMDGENYRFPFQAFWVIIEKSSGAIIGSFDFKTAPNGDGITEVGYGIGESARHKGYMTECLNTAIDFAFSLEDVKGIFADTERDNLPSINVLKRCGFMPLENPESKYLNWIRRKC